MMRTMLLTVAFCASTFVAAPSPAKEGPAWQPEPASATTSKVPATSVSTFHCLSIYWSPENGAAGKNVLVKFREAAQTAWRDGLAMRYNPMKTAECNGDYRGSIVNLKPGTAYEVALTLEGTN